MHCEFNLVRDRVSGIRLYRLSDEFVECDWPGEAGLGIDIICWYQRYVIVPPSIHASRRKYMWVRDNAPLRGMLRPDTLELLPDDWCEYLISKAGSGSGSGTHSAYDGSTRAWLDRYGADEMCPYMGEMAPKWLERVRVGSAYEAVKAASAGAVKATAEGHTGANTALSPVRDAYIAEVGARPRTARRRSESVAVDEWRR